MKDKEEIIYSIRNEWSSNMNGVEILIKDIWNAAIDMAAEQTYKTLDPFEINISILNLKFDKDEN